MIEDDLRVLRLFHRLGVRYMSLSHSFNTHWADSSGTGEPVPPRHGGLSPFGVEVVKEMNRLGMIVDVSHTADSTFYDALEASEAPVIASHSSVDGVKEHARNMSDDMLRALARNGGRSHRYRNQVHRSRRAPEDPALGLHRSHRPRHRGRGAGPSVAGRVRWSRRPAAGCRGTAPPGC